MKFLSVDQAESSIKPICILFPNIIYLFLSLLLCSYEDRCSASHFRRKTSLKLLKQMFINAVKLFLQPLTTVASFQAYVAVENHFPGECRFLSHRKCLVCLVSCVNCEFSTSLHCLQTFSIQIWDIGFLGSKVINSEMGKQC